MVFSRTLDSIDGSARLAEAPVARAAAALDAKVASRQRHGGCNLLRRSTIAPLAIGGHVTIKLHRCGIDWLKIDPHPCWKVQKALDEQGIDYEVVRGPARRGQRDHLERLSGQRKYPVIEFEDGRAYRADSKDMAARVRAGKLFTER